METDEIGTVAERVDRGISVLPENWREKITRPLNIAHARDCILGQVLGAYWEALEMLWPLTSFTEKDQDRQAILHGFNIDLCGECDESGRHEYAELAAEWQRRIDS